MDDDWGRGGLPPAAAAAAAAAAMMTREVEVGKELATFESSLEEEEAFCCCFLGRGGEGAFVVAGFGTAAFDVAPFDFAPAFALAFAFAFAFGGGEGGSFLFLFLPFLSSSISSSIVDAKGEEGLLKPPHIVHTSPRFERAKEWKKVQCWQE